MASSLHQHLDDSLSPKRILALQGGGLRGVLSLEFLQRIEDELKTRHPDPAGFRLCDYFDLIGGTSTGAIIAAALACGMTVSELKTLYGKLARSVFHSSMVHRWGLLAPKFPSERVQEALDACFGSDTTIGSDRIRTGLLIVTKRLDTGSTWPLTNHPRARYASRDGSLRLSHVVRASTAAPTYFEPEHLWISCAGGAVVDGTFIDGGVSPNNNPALQALLVATLHGHGFRWGAGADRLLLVSVGTGTARLSMASDELSKCPPAKQGILALQSLMHDCAQMNLELLQWLTRCLTPWTIDRGVRDMREDSLHGPQLATFVHYDVQLQPQWLKSDLDLDWTSKKIEDLAQMDRPENMPELAELGRLAAQRQFRPEHLPARFDLRRAH